MKTLKSPFKMLLLISIILISMGILILASVSAVFSIEKYDRASYLLEHQLLYGFLLGSIGGLIAFFTPLAKIKKLSFWFFAIGIFSLTVLVILPKIGLEAFGSGSWLRLGGFSIQPSELFKIAFILYLAAWFSKEESAVLKTPKKAENISVFKPLVPFLAVLGLVFLLLKLQSDVGTLSIIAVTAISMFFLAGTPIWQNIIIWGFAAGFLALFIKTSDYRFARWLVFLNPGFDPMGSGYQLKQSLITIGSGGLFGLGLGLSRQKFGFLPETIGDSIFPVFAEEAGFIGVMALVMAFLLFIWQGFLVNRQAKDKFSQLAGTGICIWIGLQALINICSMIGIIPLTGVPLPFISYGGSHLLAEMIGLGILLNIARDTARHT
ncbi:MAG: FtsW/RodA/SpoVE family cell cycle protein [bacterium]|nr:FtsW/RodA/SpoVE family cell cycle protein [bacterium]